MFKWWNKLDFSSLRTRSSLAIIITAAVLIEITTVVQYFFAREGISNEVVHRAKSELTIETAEIGNVISRVEVVVSNLVWVVEQHLDQPDEMYRITHRLLEENSIIVGSAIAFKPNYYPDRGLWFSPYCYRANDSILSKQLGNPDYDYHKMEWYTAPMSTGKGHWSEPYFDRGGGEMMMSTYSKPIHDSAGNPIGVFTADVSLEWLGNILRHHQAYPSSYNIVLSNVGSILACPNDTLIMRHSAQQVADKASDTTIRQVSLDMISGKSGQARVSGNNGGEYYVFYTPIGGDAGWSMAVVCDDKEIFSNLRKVTLYLFALMLVGLTLLATILVRTIRGFKHLQAVSVESERIGSELRIAHNIQLGMVPKHFPPYPERNDIDLYGYLMPAKEVGGDFYDFHLRNDKLFFCIGDVSGKGVPASLVMAVTRSLFLSTVAHEASPERIVETLNHALTKMNDTDMFVTMFAGVLDLPTGRLRYCNAAHCEPLIISDKTFWLPTETNIPLGINADWQYVGQEIKLKPQTLIFVYTDGLSEAERPDLSQFGAKRIQDVASEVGKANLTPKQFIERITQAVGQFTLGNEQNDDLTMLAIKYTAQPQFRKIHLRRNLHLPSKMESLPQLHALIDEITKILNIPFATANNIDLALEEAIVNIIDYAYPNREEGFIDLRVEANDRWIQFVIMDDGIPFDPTSRPDVDTTQSIEDRPIGGLGIHLIRNIMSGINYNRADGKNILTLTLNLE